MHGANPYDDIDPPKSEPLTIRSGAFSCTLYDIDNLTLLPLANIRKLWGIMFSAQWENEQSVLETRQCLSKAIALAKERISHDEAELIATRATAEVKRREIVVMGGDPSAIDSRIKSLKAALKKAESYSAWVDKKAKPPTEAKKAAMETEAANMVAHAERALETAINQRNAFSAVKVAEHLLKVDKSEYERIVKLQNIFKEMAEKAQI